MEKHRTDTHLTGFAKAVPPFAKLVWSLLAFSAQTAVVRLAAEAPECDLMTLRRVHLEIIFFKTFLTGSNLTYRRRN